MNKIEIHNLTVTHPRLVAEWHPKKNGATRPDNLTRGSRLRIWWRCSKNLKHEWKADINSRTRGSGCPFCANKKADSTNCLATINPDFAKEWHPIKNGNLTPHDIKASSKEPRWWRCFNNPNHEWSAPPKYRRKGCPYCFTALSSLLKSEWDPIKNVGVTPNDILDSKTLIWWKCKKNPKHSWEATIKSRKAGAGCLICAGKKIDNTNSLAAKNPTLANEWHPTKNGMMTPEQFAAGSNVKVWWQCSKNKSHEWQASIGNRHLRKSRCPDCFGTTKFKPEKSLAIKRPKLINEWHSTKNGSLTPKDVQYGSQKKYWWRCSKNKNHEWQATVSGRSSGFGCPYCSGRRTTPERSLAEKYPELVKEWHFDKNKPLTPADVSFGSRKKVWWRCPKNRDHEWEAMICARTRNKSQKSSTSNCRDCYSQASDAENRFAAELMTIFINLEQRKKISGQEADIYIPELKLIIEVDGAYWHANNTDRDLKKNKKFTEAGYKIFRVREVGLEKLSELDMFVKLEKIAPEDISRALSRIVEMFNDQLDEAIIEKINSYIRSKNFQNNDGFSRIRTSLPGVINKRNFSEVYEKLDLVSWHHKKNGQTTPEHFTASSGKKVWWQCPKNSEHEWEGSIASVVKSKKCPFCLHKRVSKDNCLATVNPKLAAEWHPSKNNSLTPNDVVIGSNKKIWWRCLRNKNHEWPASPDRRHREKSGCPYCSNNKVSPDNCLATVNPKLASEWHPSKNFPKNPSDFTPGSKKKVWWLCKKNQDHEWEASVNHRNRGSGCPICSGKKIHISNCLATINPNLGAEWHSKLNKTLTPYDVTSGSKKMIWWKCPNQHEYKSKILSRSHGHGCPECAREVKRAAANKRWKLYRQKLSILNEKD